MNWNALRSIADMVSIFLAFVSAGLLGLGCTDTGKLVCDNANVPVKWVPILVMIAGAITFLRMIVKGLTSATGVFGKETSKVIILFALFALWVVLRHALVA